MKKILLQFLKVIKGIGIFLCSFILIDIFATLALPTDPETNKHIVPDWFFPVIILISILVAVFEAKRKPREKIVKEGKKKSPTKQVKAKAGVTAQKSDPAPAPMELEEPNPEQESPKPEPIVEKPRPTPIKLDLNEIMKEEEDWRRKQRGLSPIDYELYKTDVMSGRDFEYWCAYLLQRNGFTSVEVTQESNDQGVDIVAEKDQVHYAIQCKCVSNDLGNKPVQEVYAGKEIYGCQVGVVMTNRYFTSGAQKLAEKTRVLLWDRDSITNLLRSEQ